MANLPDINVAPPVLFNIGPFEISNAMIGMWGVTLILLIWAVVVRHKSGIIPSRAQVLFEGIMEFMWDKMLIAFGSEKRAHRFFPLILTIFLTLLVANQFMLIPFVESIVTADGVQLFRAPASHYSLPIIYTVTILIISHILALAVKPIRHIGNFIKLDELFKIRKLKDIPMALLNVFLGLLDIVGEFAKLASLSTRLFGNLFAGSIIVGIIGGLTAYTQFIVPIPFVVLGILSGIVQAFVFAMLSILYISSTLNSVSPPETAAAGQATN